MPADCNERYPICVGEVLNLQVDCTDYLKTGEALTGTPTAEDLSGDLTIDQLAVSSGSLTILGRSVDTGDAITLRVTITSSSNTDYGPKEILLLCSTTSSPSQAKLFRRIIVDFIPKA